MTAGSTALTVFPCCYGPESTNCSSVHCS